MIFPWTEDHDLNLIIQQIFVATLVSLFSVAFFSWKQIPVPWGVHAFAGVSSMAGWGLPITILWMWLWSATVPRPDPEKFAPIEKDPAHEAGVERIRQKYPWLMNNHHD